MLLICCMRERVKTTICYIVPLIKRRPNCFKWHSFNPLRHADILVTLTHMRQTLIEKNLHCPQILLIIIMYSIYKDFSWTFVFVFGSCMLHICCMLEMVIKSLLPYLSGGVFGLYDGRINAALTANTSSVTNRVKIWTDIDDSPFCDK